MELPHDRTIASYAVSILIFPVQHFSSSTTLNPEESKWAKGKLKRNKVYMLRQS